MKVFVSWSGELSHAIAEAFAAWLPTVIQECREPFVSSDIAKGEAWFQAISDELADAKVGIAFITADNLASPWLHFESGAMLTRLSKQRICPVVVDVKKSEYDGPLTNLQLTDITDAGDFYKLMATVNATCDNPLSEPVLRNAFDLRWPALEAEIQRARTSSVVKPATPPRPQRSTDDKVDEVLDLLREIRATSHIDTGSLARPTLKTGEVGADLQALAKQAMLLAASSGAKRRVSNYRRDQGGSGLVDVGGNLRSIADVHTTPEGDYWFVVRDRDDAGLALVPADFVEDLF